MLTPKEIDIAIHKGCWTFEVDYHDRTDSVVLSGDGVDDLDHVDSLMMTFRRATFKLNIGQASDSYRVVDRADIAAMRQRFVEVWGELDKPEYVEQDQYALFVRWDGLH